jgi:hydroxyacylglutathione hydrolase
MKIEQIYTKCLAQGAYYIESEGEVAIIDPLRNPLPYIQQAEQAGAKIKYIFETHFHADFVSGHLDLAQKTGATIVYGPTAKTDFEKHEAKDNETFQLGKITIQVLHTPGHTPESTTYLLLDKNGNKKAIFTGDTLFIGDVGRPDLAQKNTGLTQEDLAGWLFDSLRNKIMTLPDDVMVYPAHGAGSACGKNMSSETFDTLGNQKKTNYALRPDMTRDEFIQELTEGLLPPPRYFSENALLNKKGYDSYFDIMERGEVALSLTNFDKVAAKHDALILDVRNREDFVKGFIPNSIFIGLDGGFAPWVGALVPNLKTPIVLITPEGKEEEAVTRLSRVGFDNILGYLKGGVQTWTNADRKLDSIHTIDVPTFQAEFKTNSNIHVLDVRKPGEHEKQHIINAQNAPLDFIHKNQDDIDKDKTYHIHCAGGYRSTIASSILKSRGYNKLVNVQVNFSDMVAAGLPMEEVICTKGK